MNHSLRRFLLTLVLLSMPLALHASTPGVTILKDNELAAIRGGYCPLEICEDAPGTGICQVFPPVASTICALTLCGYLEDQEGRLIIYTCAYVGISTCTMSKTYRQCILAFTTSSCSYGTDTPCGVNFVPHCHPNPLDRKCDCTAGADGTPCDWVNCIGS
jgi:hypothetical protein